MFNDPTIVFRDLGKNVTKMLLDKLIIILPIELRPFMKALRIKVTVMLRQKIRTFAKPVQGNFNFTEEIIFSRVIPKFLTASYPKYSPTIEFANELYALIVIKY